MVRKLVRSALPVLLVALVCGSAFGAAANNQDERLNFDRSIKESVDNFRILRTDNKAQMNDYVTRVFELKNAKVMEIVPYVRNVITPESGAVGTLKYIHPRTKAERNFIQVVCPKFQLAGIQQLIETLDLPGVASSPGDTRYFYRMQHRDAADVNAILVASELSGDGASAVDAPTNTLYFRDSASDFSRDLAVVKFMDVPVPQVEFEVKIYEVDKTDEAKLGLHWDAWKNMLTGGVVFGDGSFARNAGVDGFQTVAAVGGPALAQFLNYLTEKGAAKVITNTRISVQNGQTATISSMKRIPFQDYTEVLALTPGGTPALGVTAWAMKREQANAPNAPGGANLASGTDPGTLVGEKSEGIWLRITPTIGVKTLSAVTTVTVNSLAGFTKFDAPIISERRTQTTTTLTPGKAFTLGGMDKETVVKEKRDIPVLSSIPLLGRLLFSYDVDVARKSTLVVVIKPKVKNQLLYKALSLGWGTTPTTLKPDGVVFDQSKELAPNPAAETDLKRLNRSIAGEEPELNWGYSVWGAD